MKSMVREPSPGGGRGRCPRKPGRPRGTCERGNAVLDAWSAGLVKLLARFAGAFSGRLVSSGVDVEAATSSGARGAGTLGAPCAGRA